MKLILSLLLICSSTAIFAQSKKTINKRLSLDLKEVKAMNDSIIKEYASVIKSQIAVESIISPINNQLTRKREDIEILQARIHTVKGEMFNSGYNPNQFVSENELENLYAQAGTLNYEEEYYKLVSSPLIIVVEDPADVSKEKIKVQNQLLLVKINEYAKAIENNKIALFHQQKMLEEMERLKTLAGNQLNICTQASIDLDEKYQILVTKQDELRQKEEEERRERLAEETKNAKKNKKAKIKYIPPVIVEEEPPLVYEKIDYTIFDTQTVSGDSDWTWDNADVAPPPPPAPSYSENSEIYEIVEEIPEFPGGWEAMKKFLTDNLRYPPIAKEQGVEGKVYMKFVVTNTGEVSNVNVVRGLAGCPECDAEAKRVIKMMPKWKPGMNKGKAVSCYFSLPIVFKLESK